MAVELQLGELINGGGDAGPTSLVAGPTAAAPQPATAPGSLGVMIQSAASSIPGAVFSPAEPGVSGAVPTFGGARTTQGVPIFAGASSAETEAIGGYTGPTWAEIKQLPEYVDGSSERKKAIEQKFLEQIEGYAQKVLFKKADKEAFRQAILEGIPLTKTPKATVMDRLSDVWTDVRIGGEQLVGSVGGLISPAGAPIEKVPFGMDQSTSFLSDFLNPMRREDAAKQWRENYSEAREDAEKILNERVAAKEKEGEIAQFGATLGAFSDRPSLAIGRGIQQIPNILSIFTGAGITRGVAGAAGVGARALRGAQAAGPLTPQAAALAEAGALGTAARGGAAAASGALGAGQARQQVAQSLTELTEEQWNTDPEYRTLKGRVGAEAAKQQIIEDRSVTAGIIGLGLGVVAGLSGIERLLGPGAGKALTARAKRVVAELLGEEVEELTPTVLANVEKRVFAPETSLAAGTGRTAAETLAAAGGPAVIAGLGANEPATGQPRLPTPAGEPVPEGTPTGPEPGAPVTFRTEAERKKGEARAQIAAIEANPFLTPQTKEASLSTWNKRLADWDVAVEKYENSPPIVEARKQLEANLANQERIAGQEFLDEQAKAKRIKALSDEQATLERQIAYNEFDEAELSEALKQQTEALLDFDVGRGKASADSATIKRLTDDRNFITKLLEERALIETPSEIEFGARAPTAFEKDASGNYVYPSAAETASKDARAALNTLSDVAQSRIYVPRTNPKYTRAQKAALIRQARKLADDTDRALAIMDMEAEPLQVERDRIIQAVVDLARKGVADQGLFRQNAAVLARQAELRGESLSWGEAQQRSMAEIFGLVRESEQPGGPPTGPPPAGAPDPAPAPGADPGDGGTPKAGFDKVDGWLFYNNKTPIVDGWSTVGKALTGDTRTKVQGLLAKTFGAANQFASNAVKFLNLRWSLNMVVDKGTLGWYYPSRGQPWKVGFIATDHRGDGKDNIHTTAHEVGHAFDDVRRNKKYLSEESGAFAPGAALRVELEAAHANNSLNLSYPLDYGTGGQERIMQIELFAQVMGYYHSARQDLAKAAPQAYAMAEEIVNGINGLESSGQLGQQAVADVISAALAKSGGAASPQAGTVAGRAEAPTDLGPVGGRTGAGVAAVSGAGRADVLTEAADAVNSEIDRQVSLLSPERAAARREQILRDEIAATEAEIAALEGQAVPATRPAGAARGAERTARAGAEAARGRAAQPEARPEGAVDQGAATGEGAAAEVASPRAALAAAKDVRAQAKRLADESARAEPEAERAPRPASRRQGPFQRRLRERLDAEARMELALTEQRRSLIEIRREGLRDGSLDEALAEEIVNEVARLNEMLKIVRERMQKGAEELVLANRISAVRGTPATAVSVRNILAEIFGISPGDVASRLPRVEVLSEAAIETDGTAKTRAGTKVGGVSQLVSAFYTPADNTVTIIADRMGRGRERGYIFHELFHKRGGHLLGRKQMERFRDQALRWKNAPAGSPERSVYDAAFRRVEQAVQGRVGQERQEAFDEELLPYFITEAFNQGFDASPANGMKGGVAGWLSRLATAVRNALADAFGLDPGPLTVGDLVAAAHGAAQLELDAQIFEAIADGRPATPGVGTRRALEAIRGRRAFAPRLREIARGEEQFVPERIGKEQREAGVTGKPRPKLGPKLVNPIYGTRAEIRAANAEAMAPGPGVNASHSIYERFKPVKAAPIKSRSDVQRWAQTGQLPTAEWSPQFRDTFIENWVDHQRPLYNWLRDNVLSMIPWKQLKLIPGKMRAFSDRITASLVDPIAEAANAFAKRHNIKPAEASEAIGQWTTMRHIPEANAAIRAKILKDLGRGDSTAAKRLKQFDATQRGEHPGDNDPERGSMAGGYSDAEAKQIMEKLEEKYGRADLERVGDMIVDGFATMKQEALKSGQLSPEAVKNFPKFKHYVALTGTPWDDSQSDAFGSYVAPNVLKERGGMTTHVADQALVALMDRIGRVAAYASSAEFKASINDLWEQNGGDKNQIGITKLKSDSAQSPFDSDIIWQDPKGQRWIFRFSGPAQGVGQAILSKNREYADNLVLGLMNRATRLFSRAVTQWTLAFAPINMMRDVQEKSVLLRSRNVADADGSPINVNTLLGKQWQAAISPEVWRAARELAFSGKADESTYAGQLANELVKNGGLSTWGQIMKRGREEISKEIARKSGIRKRIEQLDRWVGNYNMMFEVISSLSAHQAMRELGVAPKEAAFQTLDLMNFQNMGAKTAWLRSMYSFFNPAMQSGRNFFGQITTRRGAMDALGMMFISAGIYMLARAIGGDDDELGSKLDQRGSFEIERNIPITLGDATIKIPVGFGLSQFIWANTVNAGRLFSGRYDFSTALAQSVTSFLKTFSPIPPAEIEFTKQPNNFLLKSATPTIFRPVVDLATDTNAWGQKLTAYYPDKKKFASEQGAPSTAVMYKNLADNMRSLTGIDAYPEQWRTFVEGSPLGWGPLGYAMKSLAQSNAEMEGRRKDTIDQIPGSFLWRVTGASRFLGGTSRYLDARYHEQYDKALRDVREFNAHKAEGNELRWARANQDRMRRIDALKGQENLMRSISKEYNALLRGMQNDTISLELGTRQLESIANRRETQMRNFLKLVNEWDEDELGEPTEVEE
jgi:hypothetical protein